MCLTSMKTRDKGQETLTQDFGGEGLSVLSLAPRCAGLWKEPFGGFFHCEGFPMAWTEGTWLIPLKSVEFTKWHSRENIAEMRSTISSLFYSL